jgi:predicted cupin superfamily sugar epimerase
MDLRDTGLAADAVAAALDLAPHPEGGFYRETFRDGDLAPRGARPPYCSCCRKA